MSKRNWWNNVSLPAQKQPLAYHTTDMAQIIVRRATAIWSSEVVSLHRASQKKTVHFWFC